MFLDYLISDLDLFFFFFTTIFLKASLFCFQSTKLIQDSFFNRFACEEFTEKGKTRKNDIIHIKVLNKPVTEKNGI